MRYAETTNGHLELIAEPEDTEMLSDLFDRHGHNDTDFLAQLFESTGLSPNGHLHLVSPRDVGALTDSPIVSDEVCHNDEGDVISVGKLWWFPNYAVRSLPEKLVKDGRVLLTAA